MFAAKFVLLLVLSGVHGDLGSGTDGNDYLDREPTFFSNSIYYGTTFKYGTYRKTRSSDDAARTNEDSNKTQGPSNSNTYMENKFANTLNLPYFDLTKVLDSNNETDIKEALKFTRNIYYSTGKNF